MELGTKLRKIASQRPHKRAKLRDQSGELVGSEDWADAMAQHLETVQWSLRPCGIIDGPTLGQPLPIYERDISPDKARSTVWKLRKRKAPGPNHLPAEL